MSIVQRFIVAPRFDAHVLYLYYYFSSSLSSSHVAFQIAVRFEILKEIEEGIIFCEFLGETREEESVTLVLDSVQIIVYTVHLLQNLIKLMPFFVLPFCFIFDGCTLRLLWVEVCTKLKDRSMLDFFTKILDWYIFDFTIYGQQRTIPRKLHPMYISSLVNLQVRAFEEALCLWVCVRKHWNFYFRLLGCLGWLSLSFHFIPFEIYKL